MVDIDQNNGFVRSVVVSIRWGMVSRVFKLGISEKEKRSLKMYSGFKTGKQQVAGFCWKSLLSQETSLLQVER
jgi:hypothetical protein